MEGEEYQCIKELISSVKPKATPQTPKPKCSTSTAHTISATEFGMMKDTMTALQVDMLNLKQALHSSEKLRSTQIKAIQMSIEGIKSDILQCTRTVYDYVVPLSIDDDRIVGIQLQTALVSLCLFFSYICLAKITL